MFCPNCCNEVNFDNFCTNCGVELAYFNNSVYIKEQFLSVKESHESMDNFLLTANETRKNIKAELSNPQIFLELENNPKEKSDLLDTLDEAEESMLDFKSSIYEVLNDDVKLDFFRSFNNFFGDADIKMKNCLNVIEENINYINEYREKINNSNSNYKFYGSESIDVEDFHRQVDDAIENTEIINKDLGNRITNNEILEELRNEASNRELFKNNILGSLDDIRALKVKLENYLNDKELMNQLHQEDYKYGNIEEKMNKCINEINTALNYIKEFEVYVEKIESEPKKSIPLNNKRILDL